jgi:hypothetical protein
MNFFGSAEGADRFSPRGQQGQGTRNFGIRYPSPFFDVAQQYLPDNIHHLHQWCRYYFLTNPFIHAVVMKMAEYPVTPILFDTDDDKKAKLYKDVEEQMNLRQFQVEVGIDHFTYGSCLVSMFFPFVKYLACKNCKTRYQVDKNRSLYKWRNLRFQLHCPKCDTNADANEIDVYIRSIRDIRPIRWNPENVDIKHNDVTGRSSYYYRLPRHLVNDVTLGDVDTIESLPVEFLTAIRQGKALRFSPDNIFHLKRPTIAQKDLGWGTPLIYPLLKDAFHMQILRKSQEALSLNYVMPLRFMFPGPSTGGNDQPYAAYNLSNWKSKVETELAIARRDPGYIPILPVNMGFQQMGGDAKAMMLYNELRTIGEHMCIGGGVPPEFIFGGLQWSGTNTSLRALENTFSGYNRQRLSLVKDFIFGNIARYMRWPVVPAKFERFKMADDLQRSMLYLQLNQAGKISDRRLLEEIGENFEREHERMDEELKTQLRGQRKMQVAAADVQGEALVHTSRYQAKAQALQAQSQQQIAAEMGVQPGALGALGAEGAPGGAVPAGVAPGEQAAPGANGEVAIPGMPAGATAYAENAASPAGNLPAALADLGSKLRPGPPGVDLRYIAQRAKSFLDTVGAEKGEEAKQQAMQQMKMQNPSLYQLVLQLDADTGSKVNPLDALKAPMPPGGSQRGMGRTLG